MNYKSSTVEELKELIGKDVSVFADQRINSKCRLVVSGMAFKVLGLSKDEHTLFLEPLPKEFKDRLIELPISMNGILWEIESINYGTL